MKTWAAAVLAAGLAATAWGQAAPEAAGEAPSAVDTNATVITADRMTVEYGRGIATFEGHVVAVDPRMRIESEKLTVIFTQANNIQSVTAIGNVHVRQGDKTATCRKAVYAAATDEVVLSGDAVVWRGRDRVAGQVITFWIGQDRMTCEPGYLQIVPQEGKSPAGAKVPIGRGT